MLITHLPIPTLIEIMERLGFSAKDIHDALTQQRFNNITATYILLSQHNAQVHGNIPNLVGESRSRPRQPAGSKAGSSTARPASAYPPSSYARPPDDQRSIATARQPNTNDHHPQQQQQPGKSDHVVAAKSVVEATPRTPAPTVNNTNAFRRVSAVTEVKPRAPIYGTCVCVYVCSG